jgi:alanine racemase
MKPAIGLDDRIVVENARAWKRFCAAPLYAVVKADGYGWGMQRMAQTLEDTADAFCVADADELWVLREFTHKRAIVLSTVSSDILADVLRANAAPTLERAQDIELAIRTLAGANMQPRLRLGLRPAAAWSGSDAQTLRELAPLLASSGVRVELWTHVTDRHNAAAQVAALGEAASSLRAAGVDIAAVDACNTYAASMGLCGGGAARIGVGLFGSGSSRVPGVRCALSVRAPIVRLERHTAGTRLGYGGTMLGMEADVATARCGYADGFPNTPAVKDDILSVGMQYVTLSAPRGMSREEVELLGDSTDLDDFAARAGRLPHEIVVAFGNGAR